MGLLSKRVCRHLRVNPFLGANLVLCNILEQMNDSNPLALQIESNDTTKPASKTSICQYRQV